MNENQTFPTSPDLLAALCRELLRLERREEEIAASEATRTSYSSPTPVSVIGHRTAAGALREDLAGIKAEARASGSVSSPHQLDAPTVHDNPRSHLLERAP